MPQVSLNNLMMQLRKACCHPYLIEPEAPNWKQPPQETLRCAQLEAATTRIPRERGLLFPWTSAAGAARHAEARDYPCS